MIGETDLWRCTVCGRVGTVGRCCGEETRERANMESLQDEIEALRAEVDALRETLAAVKDGNERLREVLKDADNELDWLDEDMDTCDHSVGVCKCDYWNMRRKMKAVLYKEMHGNRV